MRFLKNKIARAKSKLQSLTGAPSTKPKISKSKSVSHRKRGRSKQSKQMIRCYKNIAKNYGRAICSFALSDISEPYLSPLAEQYQIDPRSFRNYIDLRKEDLLGIEGFRALLLITERDSQEERSYKKIFQRLCEVFINYFSVNWIFSGKLSYKSEYLKLRFKMLRRVKNPELFTYIK
jgi:hypothetical protein